MEGVDASVMELTATFHLRELPPPGNTMHTKMHVSKKTLGESSLESGWVSGWGLEHMNKSREDIFEQVRLFLPGYHIRNQNMLPSEI